MLTNLQYDEAGFPDNVLNLLCFVDGVRFDEGQSFFHVDARI